MIFTAEKMNVIASRTKGVAESAECPPGRWLVWAAGMFLCALVMGCNGSWAYTPEIPSEQTITWTGAGKGWGEWGWGGDCMFAVSDNPEVLDIWRWAGNTMRKEGSSDLVDGAVSVAVLSQNTWGAYGWDGGEKHAFFSVGDVTSGKATDRWVRPDEWCFTYGRRSRNGKHVAVWATRDSPEPEASYTARFGFTSSDGRSFDWVTTVQATSAAPPRALVEHVVPSEDGAYIGVPGWDNRVAMIDVTKKRMIWKFSPLEANCVSDLAFMPDSKLLFAGDAGLGCLYGMKVDTGKVVSKWYATRSGEAEASQRITTVAVSPDGRFVGAGTGPAGEVFLFATKDGTRWLLNHGGSTILMMCFSPDSKRLATYAAGQIKIWKLPEQP